MENKPKRWGKPTEREELPFSNKNLELLIFKIFAGGPKIRKYEFSDSLKILFAISGVVG